MRGRWIIVALAVAAAAAFAVSVQAGRWWAVEGVEIGPAGSRHCFGGECKTVGVGWVGGTERWMRTGTGAWAAGFISMFVLLLVAGGTAAKRVPRLAAKTAIVSIATAAATGALFVAQFPGAPSVPGATVDRGIWLYAAGIALGLAACIGVLRAPAPAPLRAPPLAG